MLMVASVTNELDADVVALRSELVDRIGNNLQKVQMLPAIAQQALGVANDPNCSLREFARIIEQDIKLATEMLRVANSSVYCTGRPIVTLSEATSRLGLQQCKNLILTSSFASLMENFSIEEEWVRDLLWRHGMVTAVIATNLNRALRAGFQGEEFTAGLLHDIGRILLAVALPDEFRLADPVDFQEDVNLLPHERSVFGTDHAECGAWFAASNRLPECLIATIRHHHAPSRAREHMRLAAIVAAADHMANYVQRNQSGEEYDPQSNPALAVIEASGIPGARERCLELTASVLESSCRDALELCGG